MGKPIQIFTVIALVAILAMSAFQTYVTVSVIRGLHEFSVELGSAFGGLPEPGVVEGLEQGVGVGDSAACAVLMSEGITESAAQEAWALADSGSDVEAAIERWQQFNDGPAASAVHNACAAFGG